MDRGGLILRHDLGRATEVHTDAALGEGGDRPSALGDARRRVQRDRLPDQIHLLGSEALAGQQFRGHVRAVELEALAAARLGRGADIVQDACEVQELRIEVRSGLDAVSFGDEHPEEEAAEAVVRHRLGDARTDVFGREPGRGSVGMGGMRARNSWPQRYDLRAGVRQWHT